MGGIRLMVMTMIRHARTISALVLVAAALGCSVQSPADDRPSSSSAKSGASGAPSTEQEVTLEVGHCFIEPLRAFGAAWGLTRADQFGRGDAQPSGFSGDGVATLTVEGTLLYVDQDGRELTFLPTSNPDVYDTTPVVCD